MVNNYLTLKRIFLFSCYFICSFSLIVKAQSYKLIDQSEIWQDSLKSYDLSSNGIRMKQNKNKLHILFPPTQTSSGLTKLVEFDLEKQKVILQREFYLPIPFSKFSDFLIVKNNFYYSTWLTQTTNLRPSIPFFKLNLSTNEFSIQIMPERDDFRKMKDLNDTMVLLYYLYPNHPNGGDALGQFYIYNLVQQRIINSKKMELEGISVSNMIQEWINVINGEILIVHPLSGKITILDQELNECRVLNLKINGLNDSHGIQFIRSLDSILYSNIKEFNDFKATHSEEFMKMHKIELDFFSRKERIANRFKNLRDNYSYIEKVLPYDDSTFIVTVFRPEYQMEFRSVYFINKENGKVVDSILKWRCAPPEKGRINNPEDYFTVDLVNSYLIEPIFYGGKCYFFETTPKSLFETGLTKKKIDYKVFNYQKNNPPIWYLNAFDILH